MTPLAKPPGKLGGRGIISNLFGSYLMMLLRPMTNGLEARRPFGGDHARHSGKVCKCPISSCKRWG
jgi:hypothetical protein